MHKHLHPWQVLTGGICGLVLTIGLARFAYALLLPAMRADLDWSYATAGALNTVNAAGYLAGALLLPRWQARFDGKSVVVAGGIGACVTLLLHGLVRSEEALLVLRFASGVASAASFAGGGLVLSLRVQRSNLTLSALRLLRRYAPRNDDPGERGGGFRASLPSSAQRRLERMAADCGEATNFLSRSAPAPPRA